MTGLLWAALGVFGGFSVAAIGDMVSEEVRDRLDHLPHVILRLAARRLDPALRASLYGEVWLPDLTYHLKGDEARPVTRLYHGICFAVGMLASARRSSRSLNGARPQDNNPSLANTRDAVTSVADAMKTVVSPLQLGGSVGLEAEISGNKLIVAAEDINFVNAKAFRAALLELGKVPATTLILDITNVDYIAARGITTLVKFAATLTPPRRVEVECSSQAARIFSVATTKNERMTGQWSINAQQNACRRCPVRLSHGMEVERLDERGPCPGAYPGHMNARGSAKQREIPRHVSAGQRRNIEKVQVGERGVSVKHQPIESSLGILTLKR